MLLSRVQWDNFSYFFNSKFLIHFIISLWKLDKCNKYIDAVIYNLESNLKNESSNGKDRPVSADKYAAKVKT